MVKVDPITMEIRAKARLLQVASEYTRTSHSLMQELAALSVHWQGRDSASFISQVSEFRDDLILMGTYIRGCAQSVGEIAWEYDDIKLYAWDIAERYY